MNLPYTYKIHKKPGMPAIPAMINRAVLRVRVPLLLSLSLLLTLSSCETPAQRLRRELAYTAPHVARAREFIRRNPRYNAQVLLLADVQVNALSVVDLATGRILDGGRVLHGRTNPDGSVCFSNAPGSHCSSRGFARVSEEYTGRFGRSFRLDGLEKTNSNMRRRAVVLHSSRYLRYTRFGRGGGGVSQGCPTVSEALLASLRENYIKPSRKPLLLLIP
jgi:hypothetical protein